jgi:hypothetical protein
MNKIPKKAHVFQPWEYVRREFSFDNTEDTEDTGDWGVPEGYYGTED